MKLRKIILLFALLVAPVLISLNTTDVSAAAYYLYGSNLKNSTGINLNLSNTVDQAYNIYLEKNGLGGNDSYSISTPEYNIWKQEGKKYVLNNPRLNSTSDKYLDSVVPEDLNNDSGDEVLANKLNLMTDEINHEIHND